MGHFYMKNKLVFIIFIIVRILLNHLWEKCSVYYSYLFEILFVFSVYFYLNKRVQVNLIKKINKKFCYKFLPWLVFGFIVIKAAKYSGILIPFEFKNFELLFMLLVIAPVLEELIFRFALWELFRDLNKNEEIQIWVSSLLFSLAHFVVIFSVPAEFKPFVLYQSAYVFILGLGVSKTRQESNSITSSILVHFLFNLGFLIGSY